MKKLILIIIFLLISVQVYAQESFKPFKMVFLPDTHVSFKNEDDWILYKESFVIFQDVIKNLKTVPDLSYVIFGGDLADNTDNTLEDLSLFLDTLDDINFDYYAILGDREADLKADFSKQHFCSEFRQNGFNNPNITYWAQQPSDKLLFIGLDTSIENEFKGKIPQEELNWLDYILKSNPDKFTVIFMHHPAVATTQADNTVWKNFILENSDEFINLINKYPQVKLVFSGHHHNYSVKNLNNKLYVSMPSIATYPDSYKIIKVYSDKIEIENQDISFKQIIKKSKNLLIKTQYAQQYNEKKPQKVIDYQKGAEYGKRKVYYYGSMIK